MEETRREKKIHTEYQNETSRNWISTITIELN